jgi:hypothetical protein
VGTSGAADSNGGQNVITYPAAQTVSGHRVVTYSPGAGGWIYADRMTPAHASAPLGITDAAIMSGSAGSAVLAGIMDSDTWSWPAPCSLWLDVSGALVSTPPTSGFLREVARAVSPTRVMVEPEPAIVLL